jgi:hypothetical protein
VKKIRPRFSNGRLRERYLDTTDRLLPRDGADRPIQVPAPVTKATLALTDMG